MHPPGHLHNSMLHHSRHSNRGSHAAHVLLLPPSALDTLTAPVRQAAAGARRVWVLLGLLLLPPVGSLDTSRGAAACWALLQGAPNAPWSRGICSALSLLLLIKLGGGGEARRGGVC
jgi:hypothetical protein